MNLHLIDDEKFFDPFVEKLEALGLLENNLFVVRDCGPLKFIRRSDLIYGRFCDKLLIGDTRKYKKVFIHCLTSEMHDWILQNEFNELNWMIWGKDLYTSDLVDFPLYEKLTKDLVRKVNNQRFAFNFGYWNPKNVIRRAGMAKTYGKIDYVLTWIEPEYKYAIKHIKGLKAKHENFAYMFEYDVEVLRAKFVERGCQAKKKVNEMKCVLGNSGVAANNHLDALQKIKHAHLKEILIPVSYGNAKYTTLLKREIETRYTDRRIAYLDKFMSFSDYIDFFDRYDIFISNSIRPIGMGNIWMAFIMGKLVFMNTDNFMYPYLRSLGLQVYDINQIDSLEVILKAVNFRQNSDTAVQFLSKAKIDHMYLNLFSKDTSIYNQIV